jgi:phosphatidylglycerol:prolipoprotein diacylglycerol transferase
MVTGALGSLHVLSLAYLILNIDPILIRLGALAIHWYGLAYVVAIFIGGIVLLRWTRRQGIHDDQTWSLFIWGAIAGLAGGRLYFVVQQPDLVDHYLLQPRNIIAVWDGGMAFFGAIFLGTATLFALAPRYGLSRFIVLDGGVLFAAVGQIFGRFGNIVNGDILGYAASNGPVALPAHVCTQSPCIAYVSDPHILPWAFVYTNPATFAPPNVAFQPAPVYEILMNVVMLAILWPLRYKLPRLKAGLFFLLYLALYGISQFVVFFWRGSEPYTPFLGIDGLKQAQWTAIVVLLICVPLYFLIQRFSAAWTYSDKGPVPWPQGSRAAVPVVAGVAAPVAAGAVGAASRGAGSRPAERRTGATTTAMAGTSARSTPSSAAAAEVPAVELPPWQPYRARRGELRNHFDAHLARVKPGQRQTSAP